MNWKFYAPLLGAWLGVCPSAMATTVVGHPVPTGIAAGTGLTYTSSILDVKTITYDLCDDELVDDLDEVLDPVAGDEIVLPQGEDVCGLTIDLNGRFWVYGTGPSNSTFALSLGVDTIVIDIDPPITVASDGSSGGTGIRLADPNWVTASMLDLDPNEFVGVGAGHTLHDTLRDSVRYDSAAW
ncbi:MAG: hypothetical protein R3F59_31300 [Myxococcota bacterium]